MEGGGVKDRAVARATSRHHHSKRCHCCPQCQRRQGKWDGCGQGPSRDSSGFPASMIRLWSGWHLEKNETESQECIFTESLHTQASLNSHDNPAVHERCSNIPN